MCRVVCWTRDNCSVIRVLYRCKCPVGIDGTYYTILRYTLNHLHDEYIFSWHVYGPKNYVIMEYSILKSTYHQLIDHPQQSYSATRRYSTQMMSFYSISGKFCTNLLQRQCLRSIGYIAAVMSVIMAAGWLAAPLLSNNIWIRPCLMGCIK